MSIEKKVKGPFATRLDTIDDILLDYYDGIATRWEEKTGKDRSELARRYYISTAAALLASSVFFPDNAGVACVALYKAVVGHYPTRGDEEEAMAKFRVPRWLGKLTDQVGLRYGRMMTYAGILSVPFTFFDALFLGMAGVLVTSGLGVRWWAQANYIAMSRKPVKLSDESINKEVLSDNHTKDDKPHTL